MIPQSYITEWRNTAPWQNDAQVEQDFLLNIQEKMNSTLFINDMNVLIIPTLKYDVNIAVELVREKIISRI